jgi:hypothetical protein
MDEAAAVREGVRDLLSDVDPDGLREMAVEAVEESWAAPGVATVAAARKAGVEDVGSDLRRRATGVQLIYAGLSLSRRLVEDEPWASGEAEAGNVDVLVADVLVARGGHLLAYTDAVDRGVEAVRRFGRRQTDGPDTAHELEADMLMLAAHAGATAASAPPATAVMEWGETLAESLGAGDLPDVSSLVSTVDPGSSGSMAMAGERRRSTDP